MQYSNEQTVLGEFIKIWSIIAIMAIFVGGIWLFKELWIPTTISNGIGEINIDQEPITNLTADSAAVIDSVGGQLNYSALILPVGIIIVLVLITKAIK